MEEKWGPDKRIVIENVQPEIEEGLFPVKRIPGERLVVTADIFTEGQNALSANLLVRGGQKGRWAEISMQHTVNDSWTADFPVESRDDHYYTIEAWIDHFKGWIRDFRKKADAGVSTSVDLMTGVLLINESALLARGREKERLEDMAAILKNNRLDIQKRNRTALGEELQDLMKKYPVKNRHIRYLRELKVSVDRPGALFSTWYEIFPRSTASGENTHGTFRDLEKMLPYISGMGFDVLYLPPVHPVGKTHRKGKNNALKTEKGDPGSPWAIGSSEGGHTSVNPRLGNLEDFRELVKKTKVCNMEAALDIAFQCSPDHPWVREHPEWFSRRPDGSIQYAENPPKKYEDIFPVNFDTENWKALWKEIKEIFLFWIGQGVKIFRVDNPHTKPFHFWEWIIREIRNEHPDVLFLAEAFTRPKIMARLAKLGFNQSYTYFAWRNTKRELTEYMTELTRTGMAEYFRPNFWPNTPDILTEYLQAGHRPAFMIRYVLAATLSSNCGIYGPAFELCENRAREAGSEEYLDSEKYQIRDWNLDDKASLKTYIARVNRIRKENPALQQFRDINFHQIGNDQIICYSKRSDDGNNTVITVVNLDFHHTQSGWVNIPAERIGINPSESYQVADLLSGSWYVWKEGWNYVELNPHSAPAHIFRVKKKMRTERDFDYYV